VSSESKVAAAPSSHRPAVEVRRHGMSRRQAWVTAAMAVLILIPSMYGFLGKFVEFVHIYRGTGGGEFAVAPILNYLLASAGFFCMLLWAAWNGMFRDVEKPKVDFLENEARLDGGRVQSLFPRR
jgi:hypothetical protein